MVSKFIQPKNQLWKQGLGAIGSSLQNLYICLPLRLKGFVEKFVPRPEHDWGGVESGSEERLWERLVILYLDKLKWIEWHLIQESSIEIKPTWSNRSKCKSFLFWLIADTYKACFTFFYSHFMTNQLVWADLSWKDEFKQCWLDQNE